MVLAVILEGSICVSSCFAGGSFADADRTHQSNLKSSTEDRVEHLHRCATAEHEKLSYKQIFSAAGIQKSKLQTAEQLLVGKLKKNQSKLHNEMSG